jgi:diacylglycerol kinase
MSNKTILEYIKGRLKSFKYAFKGLFYTISTQKNMQIHLIATVLVTFAGFYFKVTITEWLILILTIIYVISAEFINTAIEEIVNFVSPNFHPLAGRIKDIAAAVVLFSAIFAVIVGAIIFIPKIIFLF